MLAVAYAFVIGVFVYKEIRWSQLPKIFIDSAITSGIVIFMVGAASSFSLILAFEQVPAQLARLMLSVSSSPMVFYILSISIFTILAAVLMKNGKKLGSTRRQVLGLSALGMSFLFLKPGRSFAQPAIIKLPKKITLKVWEEFGKATPGAAELIKIVQTS